MVKVISQGIFWAGFAGSAGIGAAETYGEKPGCEAQQQVWENKK